MHIRVCLCVCEHLSRYPNGISLESSCFPRMLGEAIHLTELLWSTNLWDVPSGVLPGKARKRRNRSTTKDGGRKSQVDWFHTLQESPMNLREWFYSGISHSSVCPRWIERPWEWMEIESEFKHRSEMASRLRKLK